MRNQAIFQHNIRIKNFINFLKGAFLIILITAFSFSSVMANFKNNSEKPPAAIKIKGKVTTEDGTIPGVNVYLKGTQTGTLTNADGTFTFPKEVKEGDILVFSFLGYKTLEYTITTESSTFIEVKLESEAIVITGALVVNSQPTGIHKFFAKVKAIF